MTKSRPFRSVQRLGSGPLTIRVSLICPILIAVLLLTAAGCGPAEPTEEASRLIGIWHLQRSTPDPTAGSDDFMRFMEDGRLIWAASKGDLGAIQRRLAEH